MTLHWESPYVDTGSATFSACDNGAPNLLQFTCKTTVTSKDTAKARFDLDIEDGSGTTIRSSVVSAAPF